MLLGVMSIVDEKSEEISNEKKIYNHHNYMMDVSKGFRTNVQCPNRKRDLASVNALMDGAEDTNPTNETTVMRNLTGRRTIGNFVTAIWCIWKCYLSFCWGKEDYL